MKSSRIASLFILATLLSAAASPAIAATLGVGDPAPKLQTGKWVQGEAVASFAKDKVYIVEFWATWCGPCRATIPHLNELHQKFKDKGLIVIGQNVWETDEAQVKPFVEKMGDKMTYRVALDDKTSSQKGAMAETWMEAAGQNGIPAAFIVAKDGRIAWIGHPATLEAPMLEKVLDGSFDVAKAAADFKEQRQNEERMRELSQKFGAAMQAKQWDEAESLLNQVAQQLPENRRDAVQGARMEILLGRGDFDGAAKLAEGLAEKNKSNPMLLNQLAWNLLTKPDLKGAALDAACKIATTANEAAGGKDPSILDTLARAAFRKGDKDKAVELQTKAVDLVPDEDAKKQLKATLDSYKSGKLPETE